MAKVQCPECGEINNNVSSKCYKCGSSLRKERIKKFVEDKHGDKLNYKKKPSEQTVFSDVTRKGSWFGKLLILFVFLVLLGVSGIAAALYFNLIDIHDFF